jgi:putative NIF3 family GTP cyclohydrolase 1 type 2
VTGAPDASAGEPAGAAEHPVADALPTVAGLAAYAGALLGAERYASTEHGVHVPSPRLVRRLGLALEGGEGTAAWAARAGVDALWLHRPWRLPPGLLPGGVGVWFTHLPFDDRLTTGLNPRLATALRCTDVEPFGRKDDRTIGMLARTDAVPAVLLRRTLAELFGGLDAWSDGAEPDAPVRRLAVVGAMSEPLVRDAAERGATLYVTGQLRPAAGAAVRAAGIAVAAVGHARAERWGMRALAGLLRERWAALDVVVEGGAGG